MIVRISDYGDEEGRKFVDYEVRDLSLDQINYLNENLVEKNDIEGDILRIRMFFEDELYPFQSEVSKFRLDDFIAREEIEMTIFLSGFLEDM